MSTLKTVNIQHPSSASVNAGTDTSGNFLIDSGYGSLAPTYGCRAWVNFNGTGTVAIRGSGNVSSITDNGTGDYTVNFTTAMPDRNYSVVGTTNGGAFFSQVTATPPTASSCRVQTLDTSSAASDRVEVNITFFR